MHEKWTLAEKDLNGRLIVDIINVMTDYENISVHLEGTDRFSIDRTQNFRVSLEKRASMISQ